MRNRPLTALVAAAAAAAGSPAAAAQFSFSTGNPDGLIATVAGQGPGGVETETADDFVLGRNTRLVGGSFTGLIPLGLSLAAASSVKIEFYRVFPGDSANPSSGRVPTRINSPADVDFIERDSSAGDVSYTTSLLNAGFTAANSVISGINPSLAPFTGGEGPVSGQEVRFDFSFSAPLTIAAGHFFFVPQVTLSDGSFLWLSAAKPTAAPGTPFLGDLQSWIRNEALQPDWLRVGTDITHQGPFNAVFTLDGATVPEPASWALMIGGFLLVGGTMRRRNMATVTA